MSGLFENAVARVKRHARVVLAAMMVVLSVMAGSAAAQTITNASVSPGVVQGMGKTATFTVNYNSGTRVVSSISVASEIGAVYNCTGYSAGVTNQNVTCVANYVTQVGDVGKTLNEQPVVTLMSNGVPTQTTYNGVLSLVVQSPPDPIISSITPNSGPVVGGNTVTINGANFIAGSTTVVFEWDEATNVVVNSPTSLTATVPAGVEGPVEVLVTTQGGATGRVSAGYTYGTPAPTVTAISPSSGLTSGGTSVTITGTGFIGATGVTFGATAAASYTVNSATRITATSPAGSGTVGVVITTPDGTSATSAASQFTYKSSIADLSALSISAGTLSPTFSTGTTSYSASVSYTTTSINIAPTVSNAAATVTVNGVAVTSGSPSGAIALAVGANAITTVVTAQDGTTTKSYTTTVIRAAASTNANLSSLALSSGSLTPGFASGTTSYTASVPNTTAAITVTPTVSSSNSTVTVNGVSLASGSASGAIGLSVGTNTITTVVTAQDGGTTKTYTTSVTREAAAPTLSLSPSALSGGETVGQTYAVTFSTAGGVAPYSYAVTAGALPAGLSLTSNGTLSGTPTAGGSFNFTVTATDSSTGAGAPYSTARAYTMTVAAPTITIAPTTVPAAKVAVAYSQQISAANGTGPYNYVISAGTLPDGLTLTPAGVLEGTPSRAATFNFTVRATDSSTGAGPFSGARAYSLTVNPPVPTVSSISPTAGPTTGGTSVVITGTGFTGVTALKFGAANGVAVTVVNATRITATSPAGTGTVDITVTTASGTSATSAADQFTYVGAPTVTSISPTTGPASGATTVIITGTNLSGATAVTFGATAATGFTVNSATQITATAPAGSGTVDVRITTAGGTSATSAADQFTYVGAPTVTSISPTAGPASGGTTVTITGTGFSSATAVTFGATAASGFTVNSATQITATAPAGSGTVDVRVTTAGGTSATSAADQFTYVGAPTVSSISPSSGPATGGTTVTITGTGFSSARAVTFGATAATGYTVNSATQITAMAPAGSGTVDVRVTTTGGTSATSAADQYTYVGAPTVTSISPTTGPASGGTTVAITGTGFSSATAVTFGATAATGYTVNSATQITATTPAGTGAVDVRVTTAGGISATSAADQYTYVGAPSLANISQTVIYDTPTGIDLSGAISGEHDSIAVATAPAHGVTSVAGDVITYTPNAGYSGSDSFTWSATGLGGTSTVATVTLTVGGPPRPEIDTPTDPVVVPPSAGGSGSVSIDLGSLSQGPIDGYRITAVSQFGVAEVTNGTAAAPMQARASAAPQAAGPYRLVYTPAANFMGEDTVTVVAYGPGGDSSPVTFTFQVAGKAPDLSGAVLAGASVTFTPTAGLVGGPFQALRITSAPGFGTATVNGLSLQFTPGANGGTTTFDYVVDLPFGPSAAGRVSLTSNAMPGSEALVAQTLQGVPVTVRLGDVAGGPFTGAAVVSVAPVTAGEATIAKAGDDYDLTFVSTGDFSGEVVVTYSLSNASGTTNSTLTVTVEARPDPSLDPEVRGVATSQVTSARRFADAQINNFQQRLRDLHDGTNGSSNGLSLNLGLGGAEADRDPQQALRRQLGQDRTLDPGALGGDRDREMLGLDLWAGRPQAAAAAATSDDRLTAAPQAAEGAGASVGLWTSGSVDWGRQDATGQRDSRFTTQGATVGVDVKVSDQLILGGGVGYGEDKTRIGDNGSVTQGKAVTGALYASWRPAQAFYVDGVFGFANLDFTSRRWVEGLAGQADGYADGDRSGDVRFASAAFGRVLRSERVTSDFYARLDARDITLDGFTETGGGLSALNWDEIEQKSLSANLGASWRWTLDSRRYGQFRPTARVEWSHELEDIGAQGVRYADWTTSPTYLVPLNAWSRNAINLDLGTEWSLSDRLMLSLGYRGALGDASTSHGAQIGMKYGW